MLKIYTEEEKKKKTLLFLSEGIQLNQICNNRVVQFEYFKVLHVKLTFKK